MSRVRVSVTFLYTIFRYGYPPSVKDVFRSIEEIRRLGFHYLEMEGLGREHLAGMHRSRHDLVRALGDAGLRVHNFCVVDPALVSTDAARQRAAVDRFRLGAELGDFLGAETLHLASYAPPVRYAGDRPYRLSKGGGYRFANRTQVVIPRGFEWDKVWGALVRSCQSCADIAAGHGKIVLMEPRVGEVICSVDSLRRLIEQVGRPNFKANFDTGHFSAQRENVVLALYKLRGHFANIHISDNDPVDTEHLPVGDGLTDWPGFFRALKEFRYEGYLGLDLGTRVPLEKGYRRSVRRIRRFAADAGLKVEI